MTVQHDHISGPQLDRLAATLRCPPGHLRAQGLLPRGWHLAFCIEAMGRDQLGVDGLPRSAAALPSFDGFGTRVMGATSMVFHGDIPLESHLRCDTRVAGIQDKAGRSGPLRVLTIERRYSVAGRGVVGETQEVVYLPAAPAHRAPDALDLLRAGGVERAITLDEIDVFRFSAVTFNSHRVHYDHPYAVGAESWPGVLVQAKLLALLLLDAAAAFAGGPPLSFSFRSVAPLPCPASVMLRLEPHGDGREMDVTVVDARTVYLRGQARF